MVSYEEGTGIIIHMKPEDGGDIITTGNVEHINNNTGMTQRAWIIVELFKYM